MIWLHVNLLIVKKCHNAYKLSVIEMDRVMFYYYLKVRSTVNTSSPKAVAMALSKDLNILDTPSDF